MSRHSTSLLGLPVSWMWTILLVCCCAFFIFRAIQFHNIKADSEKFDACSFWESHLDQSCTTFADSIRRRFPHKVVSIQHHPPQPLITSSPITVIDRVIGAPVPYPVPHPTKPYLTYDATRGCDLVVVAGFHEGQVSYSLFSPQGMATSRPSATYPIIPVSECDLKNDPRLLNYVPLYAQTEPMREFVDQYGLIPWLLCLLGALIPASSRRLLAHAVLACIVLVMTAWLTSPSLWGLSGAQEHFLPTGLCFMVGLSLYVGFIFFLCHGNSDELVCRECGYDLARNISGVCPECGTAITSNQQVELDRAARIEQDDNAAWEKLFGKTWREMSQVNLSRSECLRILDIEDSASPEDIQHDYRHLALEHHPDRNHGQPSERFIEISIAYRTLKQMGGPFPTAVGLSELWSTRSLQSSKPRKYPITGSKRRDLLLLALAYVPLISVVAIALRYQQFPVSCFGILILPLYWVFLWWVVRPWLTSKQKESANRNA